MRATRVADHLGRWLLVLGLGALVGGCGGPGQGLYHRPHRPTASSATAAGPTTVSAPPTSTTAAPPAPTVSLLVEPSQQMAPVYAYLASATTSLDMTMYELNDPTAEAILAQDAHRGVRVRVLLDRAYSGAEVNAPAYRELLAGGVEVRWAASSTILHQKTISVDAASSLVMTGNLTASYYPTSRDFAVLDTNPKDVAAIESVFSVDWAGATPQPGAPKGADLVWSPGSEPALVALIDAAHRSLLVENEEMDAPAIEAALERAASRGVEVDVVMTHQPRWSSAFNHLAAAKVRVGTYTPGASLYIHAKVIVADHAKAFVGSENFSASSMDDNRELGIVTTDPAVVHGVEGTVAEDFSKATPWRQ